mgnify:CR=1 FL=1
MKKIYTSLQMRWLGTLAVLLAFVCGANVNAQNVTISPSSGNMITGVSGANDSETGIYAGFKSLWKHNQLSLTMGTSDFGSLTQDGDLFDPACAMTTATIDGAERLVVAANQTQTFIVVSLPKGYRFTGYTAVVAPVPANTKLTDYTSSSQGGSANFNNLSTCDMCFYETEKWDETSPFTNDGTNETGGTKGNLTTLEEGQYLAVAEDGEDHIMNLNEESKNFVISRTSMTDDDMGNRLYFWIGKGANGYALYFKSFELYFTAEGAFETEVLPISVESEAKRYVTSPFSTSKTDIGAVKYGTITSTSGGGGGGSTKTWTGYYYSYSAVKDLVGYTHLYQEDAVAEGGIPTDGSGTILPVIVGGNSHYAFGTNTYYVEPPTTIRTSSSQEAPIGFRIVGATFKPLWGEATAVSEIEEGSVTRLYYGSLSGTTGFYLTTSLLFGSGASTNTEIAQNSAAAWTEDEYGNWYIGSGEYKQYLACYGSTNARNLSLSSAATGSESFYNLRRDENGRFYYTSRSGTKYYLYAKQMQEGGSKHWRGFLLKTKNNVYGTYLLDDDVTETTPSAQGFSEVTSTTPTGGGKITIPAFTPGAYTLTLYKNDGTVRQTIEISDSEDEDIKEYSFDDFNNDAVKFTVEVANGQAMIDVTLKLQALNPYIDQMSVVCTEAESQLHMTQTFTASDFTVNGGTFHFILPSDVADKDVNITFEDLYSHYGDETYDNMGNARYSFVTSPYFSAFDGVAENAVAPTNPAEELDWNDDASADGGLYDTRYSSEIPSTHKIYTSVAGNKAFKFNNAEEVSSSSSTENTLNLKEYFFSVERYLAPTTTSFDDGTTGTGGTFEEIVMNANNKNGHSNEGTYYLFTADETRYNIAPTSAWQHRSYAFYTMGVSLETASYTPNVEFKKIYDNTYGSTGTGAYYGAVVTAPYEDDGETKQGYASTDVVFQIIEGAMQASSSSGTITGYGTYEGKEDGLTSAKQLLYLDFSQLAGTYQITTAEHGSMDDYSGTNAPNCLIFLPVGASAPNNNVAYKTKSGIFQAAHNIELTDMEPFYTPYDIQVDAANYVLYDRKVSRYGAVDKASIIMPFAFIVDNDGVYKDPDSGNDAFSLHTMQATDCLTDENPDSEDEAPAFVFFPKIESVKNQTEPNKPYLLRVIEGTEDSSLSFKVRQKGGTVKATSSMATDYLFSGESASGSSAAGQESDNSVSYQFQAYGGYSGKTFNNDKTKTYFYFANNRFVSSDQLMSSYSTIKAYPFRSFYVATKGSNVKGLSELGIIFNEGIGNGEVTGIEDVQTTKPDLMIEVGKGYMTLTSTADQDVKVYSVSGVNVLNAKMQVGESKTVAVPSGIYIVNGAKLIVK